MSPTFTRNPNSFDQAPLRSHMDESLLNDRPFVSLRSTNTRWIVLFFACFTCMGDYYCGNLTQALQSYLMKDFNVDNLKFNTLTTASSAPSIILPFVGGAFMDRFGIRPTFFLFAFIVIIGQAIVTYGVALLDFDILIFGRVIASIGAGPLFVAKSALLVKWFIGKELSFSLGAALCVSRLGSSADSVISPIVYSWTNQLYIPFLVGTGVCVFAWITVICINHYDLKLDMQEAVMVQGKKPEDKEIIPIKAFKSMKKIYWIIVLSVGLYYGVFFGFTGNLNDHMVKRFGFTPGEAGALIPIIYFCPMFITPFFGTFVDRKGKRVLMILLASIIYLASHIWIAFLNDSTAADINYGIVLGLVGVGIFYSIYAAVIWPCIALVVDQGMTGVAYGLTNSFQCVILSFLPLILGEINVLTEGYKKGYFWSQIVLAGMTVMASMVTLVVYHEDLKTGGILDKPGTEREVKNEDDSRKSVETNL